jgi:hypothetical protein
MSNVVALKTKMIKRLAMLEHEIHDLCIERRKVSDLIADRLLEIDEQELWRSSEHTSLHTYLDELSTDLAKDGISLTGETMKRLLHGARFRKQITDGKLPKKYKAFVERTSAHDRGHLAVLVRARQKAAATPINEETAFRMLIDDGYYDGHDLAAQRTTAAVHSHFARAGNPEALKMQVLSSLEHLQTLLDGHKPSFIQEALDDVELRRSARRVSRLLNRHIIEV